MSNPIYSLRQKISTNNHALRRGQNLVPLQIGYKIMDYFTKSETFGSQWHFTYAGNKLYLHKKENHYRLLILTTIQVTVLRRGQFLSPNVIFNIDRIKYHNICKLPKQTQMNKNQNMQRNKNYKLFSEKMKMNTKKIVTFQTIFINYEND